MKKIIIASILTVGLAVGVASAHNTNQGMGGYNGQGYGGHMMGGGYGAMGPGMMNGGYGMMGGGYGAMGPGMMNGFSGNNGYGNCPGAANFGENGWNSASHQKFLEDTVSLRKELNDKAFEYTEAKRNPNTSREQLAAIEKEIINLRTQLQDKAQQY